MALALTLFIRVLVSPSLALLTIAGIYGNFWVPQIIRSARRGTASGLRLEYLLGTTACRAFFALCELELNLEWYKWYSFVRERLVCMPKERIRHRTIPFVLINFCYISC